jgi:phosphohistidine phosphatase SixA
MKRMSLVLGALLLFSGNAQVFAADTRELLSVLKKGNHVIIFRHGATDDSQKDVYPFRFDDMKAQRQLSEKGRETARKIGAAVKQQGIPIGVVYTSRLNRAIETGQLLSGKEIEAVDALTDSGAGSVLGMANPTGTNAKARFAMRELLNKVPEAGTNILLVTHKTNFADAFGKEAGDVQEAEAFVYKPNAAAPATFVGRIKAEDWTNHEDSN